jgi:hypothetical protein
MMYVDGNQSIIEIFYYIGGDPSAGSPTDTL